MTTKTIPVELLVDGIGRRLDVPASWRLLDLLRDGLGLTGTKEGCEDGTCGTCVVLVDGRMTRACRLSASGAAGREVLTIEGLGSPERPHPLQEAFVAADAVQCGFCTPGMVMAAAALLGREPHPSRRTIERWLGSNLCRCTGYRSIVDAIERVANDGHGRPSEAITAPATPASAPIVRLDGLDKATGRTLFAADHRAEGMLHAVTLRSPVAHADIVRLDVERASTLPGVRVVLTARDVPGANSYGRRVKDEPVLAGDRVRKVGDPVALVVADSREEALAALASIDVEYRELRAAFTPDESLSESAPPIHPGGNLVAEHSVRAGDVKDGFARADIIVERTYETTWNEHAYLEPEAALAAWEGETLVVRTATQYPHYQRTEIARVLGLPMERVRVMSDAVGGAFGGKTEISCQALAALGAWHTGRPVRIVYGRAESFATTTKRHPYRIRCRAGATRRGDVTALEIDMLADTGAYASFGPGLMVKTFGSAAGPYRWPNLDLHGRVAFTNNPTAGCMRGPGTTQVAFALESLMDELAARIGMDPLDFRERNRLRAGDRLSSGQVLAREPGYEATLTAIRPHWREALARCGGTPEEDGSVRRGVGVASVWYGIGGGGGGPVPGMDPTATVGRAPGRAAVDLLADGTVRVRTGAVELGQGTATALAVIAAEELGLPLAAVSVASGDSACPDAGPTVGSRVTFFVGNAVRRAAGDLGEAILGTAGALLARPVAELAIADGAVRVRGDARNGKGAAVPLSEIARARRESGQALAFEAVFDVELPAFDPAVGLGEPYAMYVTGTQMAEVEVDARSGRIRVVRVVAAHDVGRPVFPAGVVGQIEGGVAMGVGFALTEEFVPSETRGFREYRIPRTRDVPEMEVILVGDADETGDLCAKGVAECSNMVVAPAIANAVAMATGRRVARLPLRLPPSE